MCILNVSLLFNTISLFGVTLLCKTKDFRSWQWKIYIWKKAIMIIIMLHPFRIYWIMSSGNQFAWFILTLMMTSAQVVETSVTTTDNIPSQDYTHPDDQTTLLLDLSCWWIRRKRKMLTLTLTLTLKQGTQYHLAYNKAKTHQ